MAGMVVYYESIPLELRLTPQWVCWHYVNRDGKPSKLPVVPKQRAAGQRQ